MQRVYKAIAIAFLLFTGFAYGGLYTTTEKDGVHPPGWLALSCVLLSLAYVAARQKV